MVTLRAVISGGELEMLVEVKMGRSDIARRGSGGVAIVIERRQKERMAVTGNMVGFLFGLEEEWWLWVDVRDWTWQ